MGAKEMEAVIASGMVIMAFIIGLWVGHSISCVRPTNHNPSVLQTLKAINPKVGQ